MNELENTSDNALSTRPRAEVEEAALKWFDIATNLKDVQETLVADLEHALTLIRSYQRSLSIAMMPDPCIVEARKLLAKYGLTPWEAPKPFRIYVDGKDITEHPDSHEGSASEMELSSGVEMAELVQDAEGNFHLLPTTLPQPDDSNDALLEADDPDEPVDPESRDWLNDD